MREVTGQEALVTAADRLAGGSPVQTIRVLRLRDLRPDVEGLDDQVSRWLKGEIRTPADIAIRALDALGAIRWDAYDAADELHQQAEDLAPQIEEAHERLDGLDSAAAETP